MGLFIRMVLYLASGMIAGAGFASFDDTAGTLTVNIDDVAAILGGIVTFAGTFIFGRFAKTRGGQT